MPPSKSRKTAASKKKKQTRLTFDPVDPSSSASKGPSPAKIRYLTSEPSSSTRPLPSSATVPDDDSGSDDILLSSKKSAEGPRGNGRRSFQVAIPTPVKVSRQTGKGHNQTTTGRDDSEDEIAINPSPTSQPFTKYTQPSHNTSSKGRKQVEVDTDSSDGSSPEENASPERQVAASKRGTRSNATSSKNALIVPLEISTTSTEKSKAYVEASSNSDDSQLPRLSLGGSKRSRPSRTGLFSSIPKGRSSSPRITTEESDSDSDVIISTQPGRRQKKHAPDMIDDDDDEEDVDNPISSPLKRRRPIVDSDDSDIVSSPIKRRRPINNNPEYLSDNDCGQSDESSQNKLKPQKATQIRTTRQSRTRKHRTEKEKNLELLRRRRAGEAIDTLTETSESDSESDNESDFQKLSEFEDDEEEEEDEAVQKTGKMTKKKKVNGNEGEENLDEYDSDFIVDDDDAALGVPDQALLDIPLEFTHQFHKPLKEHFKDAVEWMVHKKINPGFNRKDPVYIQAFSKLDDEYGGYAKSKFVSTQWTAEFVRAIYARPEFLVRDLAPGEEFQIAGQVICQVCNHRKYIPKYEIQFAGKAYHKDTLDEVEPDSDSDDSNQADDDEDVPNYNADGQEIPSLDRTWLSGKYCKANAEQAHSLIHWKYALNQWVLGNLEFEGYLEPAKLVEREKMTPKQRNKCANDIVDAWDAHRQIKDLYRDFKINLETARETQQFTWKNGRGH